MLPALQSEHMHACRNQVVKWSNYTSVCYTAVACKIGCWTNLVVGRIEQPRSLGNSTMCSLDQKSAATTGLGHVPSQQFIAGSAHRQVAKQASST